MNPNKPLITSHHNRALMQKVLSLVQESPHGLTPSNVHELLVERNQLGEAGLTPRGAYQRVFRAINHLADQGLLLRVGKRYRIDEEALRVEVRREAREVLQKAFRTTFITQDVQELQAALTEVMAQVLQEPWEGSGQDLNQYLED